MQTEIQGYTAGQTAALEAMRSRRNVFLSGNAGTGKSYILNAYIEELDAQNVPYLAMAPTGIAALNLRNGSTIHRTLQVKLGILDPNETSRKELSRKVLNEAEVIIIDEISMCRIDLFERVMRMILFAKRSSGSKQVIVVGDFFQLPPVMNDSDRDILMQWWPGCDDGYAFKSPLWQGMGFEPHVLTEVVRQQDPEFIDQLNLARVGNKSCIDYFNQHSFSDRKRAPENVLWLCATNRLASNINQEQVDKLISNGGKPFTYIAYEEGDVKNSDKATDERLRLVPGARVMLLANLPDFGLSNGSLGTVVDMRGEHVTVDFDDYEEDVVDVKPKRWDILKSWVRDYTDKDGKEARELVTDSVGSFTQIPLRLAFAVTIHKSQGQTFDECIVHSAVFNPGMLYVALSRCTTFDGLRIWPKIEPRKLYANQSVVDFYQSIENGTYDTVSGQLTTQGANPNSPTLALDFSQDEAPSEEQESSEAGTVFVKCPAVFQERVQGYIDALIASKMVV